MSSPETLLEQWIIATLKANAAITALVAGRVYTGIIPQGAPLPAVRVCLLQSTDRNYQTGERALTRDVYQVVGITQGASLADGIALRDAIDAALQGQQIRSITLNAKITRVGRVSLPPDIDAGEQFNLLGGKYKVIFYGGK